jgi:large subunit ribosomal protein L24e
MAKCSFCGKTIETGTGLMFVEKTGKVFYFDSKKCEKNLFKLGRDNRKFKWSSEEKKTVK